MGATREQPPYGDERLLIISTRSKKGKHRLERQVFSDAGFTHFWDDDAKDWVSWTGEYIPIEVLGHFDSPESARQFLIKREKNRHGMAAHRPAREAGTGVSAEQNGPVSEAEVRAMIERLKEMGLIEVNPDDLGKPWGEQRLRRTALGELLAPSVEILSGGRDS